MRKLPLTIVAAAALAMPAWAALEGDLADTDLDGDGMLSMEEVKAAWPDFTEESFTTLDADADGFLNEEEIATGQQDGTIPMSEG